MNLLNRKFNIQQAVFLVLFFFPSWERKMNTTPHGNERSDVEPPRRRAKQTNQTLTPHAIRKSENSKHSNNRLHNRIDKTLFS
jgi:hypothetical protein